MTNYWMANFTQLISLIQLLNKYGQCISCMLIGYEGMNNWVENNC